MLHFLLILYIGGVLAEDVPIVETLLGTVFGYHRMSYEGRIFSAFEGIPYAQPPIDELRFEPPKPSKAWNGVLNATKTHVCTQIPTFYNTATDDNVSEDCLYLNVYIPNSQPSRNDNLNVLVYIHGGGFMAGDGAIGGPDYIMDRNVAYVTLNYRLGILGFLSTEDTVVPGNNGLKDQQCALKWLQEHIKNFGGNPKSVTLIGVSAGGASVHYHYFSPKSKGLFHRGISRSGAAIMPWASQEGALRKTEKLAASLNCQQSNVQDLINCLKKVPVDELVGKTQGFYFFNEMPIVPFAPVVEIKTDSAFITKHPFKQLEDEEMNDVPWLTWITTDEGLLALMYGFDALDEIDEKWDLLSEYIFSYNYVALDSNKKEIAHKIKSFYFQNNKISENNSYAYLQAFGDRHFNVGFETAVRMQSKASKSPVYAGVYGFDKGSMSLAKFLGVDVKGVAHGDDDFVLHYVKMFSFNGNELTESEKYIKNVLLDFITSFAKDGKPIANGIAWERMTTKSFNYLFIRDVKDIRMVENNKLTPKEFWDGLGFYENSKMTRALDEL